MIILYEIWKLHDWRESSKEEIKNHKSWRIVYKNKKNELHREDGPAIEYWNGGKSYWYNGKQINVSTDKEFKQYIKIRVFK
jgi:hypothetical protein